MTFTANNDGKVFTKTYAFPGYEFNGTAPELLKKLKKTNEVFSTAGNGQITLGGFLNPESEYLNGWTVYTDGFNTDEDYGIYDGNVTGLDPDGESYSQWGSGEKYKLSGKKDYLFVAQLNKNAAENIVVASIPSVYYDTRAHVSIGTNANYKKQAPDLRICVNIAWGPDATGERLVQDKDYTVKYLNNTAASMTLSENGVFVPTWKSDAERPQVVITGKGKYKGFTATAYFEILPHNLGDSEYSYQYIDPSNDDNDGFDWDWPYKYITSSRAVISGINKNTYVLKGGKISEKISPKVTKSFSTCENEYSSKITCDIFLNGL